MIYLAGRAFQLMGLIAMPSAIWLGAVAHYEKGCIAVFVSSILVFYLGHALERFAKR